MLDMGFIDDIKFILSRVPEDRQLSLFSATMDKSVMNVCHRYMKNPEKILVSKDEIALTQLNQYYMIVNSRDKLGHLLDILKRNHMGKAIVFCNTRRSTDWLARKLHRHGYNARPLHGGFTQAQRDRVTDSFRNGNLKILIATDVAARGLDIQGITHIINYDVPMEAPVYFHRIGRTARMGNDGTAITLVGYGEIPDLNKIKTLTKTNIEELPVTTQQYC
jgi:ATP-dependent RNA helicase DeaD